MEDKVCTIDRFEGDYAVIEYGRETFNFPKALLPEGCKAGDALEFHIHVNNDLIKDRVDRIEALRRKLFK